MLVNVELDVSKTQHIEHISSFAIKHKCPAVVAPPNLTTNMAAIRAMMRGKYKIFAAIDWPKGNQYLNNKFRNVPTEALSVDGFEVLLTSGSRNQIRKETKFLVEFFKNHFPPNVELRFVLGWGMPDRNEEMLNHMCESLKSLPGPSGVRTTISTKLPTSVATVDGHNSIMSLIRNHKVLPIKISGNITNKILNGCKTASKFGCTLEQANAIVDNEKAVEKVSMG